MLRSLSTFAVTAAMIFAQEPTANPAPPQGPALPAAHTGEARKLVEGAIDKMLAYGRGRFATTESQDQAMMRNAGLPFGDADTDIDGGWSFDRIWGEWDGREFVMANGRMLAKVDGEWRLRRHKVAGGVELPFTLDPDLLFTVLKQQAKQAMDVVHVQAGKLRGKPVTILTTKLVDEAALEFADAGVIPDVGGNGFGALIVIGGLGGLVDPPRPELETYLAFTVDPDNGDLLRFAARTYSTDEMGNVAVQIQGGGGADGEEDEEEEEEEADPNAPMKWRRGFPVKKPKKDQSVMTFRADFKKLGQVKPPELEPAHKALLKLR